MMRSTYEVTMSNVNVVGGAEKVAQKESRKEDEHKMFKNLSKDFHHFVCNGFFKD